MTLNECATAMRGLSAIDWIFIDAYKLQRKIANKKFISNILIKNIRYDFGGSDSDFIFKSDFDFMTSSTFLILTIFSL